ncbi:hypothetical protein C5167_021826 [Papaver somniferum]|uniref:Large ribosomal subunit protein uL23 N-terminal domain-containing protein n=1 Tax=Papaver somniferum TaxID=3469 RepID=A0A4Y7JJU2_PAPSO|nr:hypothetical protein C5167_021826 [Papaver somniferum]
MQRQWNSSSTIRSEDSTTKSEKDKFLPSNPVLEEYEKDVVVEVVVLEQFLLLVLVVTVTKKADPKVLANKASKAVKDGASTIKKKAKNICTSVTFHRPKTLQKARNHKYQCISALPRNKLDHYQILKYPLTTESAMKKIEDNNKKKTRMLSRRCTTSRQIK